MEIEEKITALLLALDKEKITSTVERLKGVIGVQQKNHLLFVKVGDLKPFLAFILNRLSRVLKSVPAVSGREAGYNLNGSPVTNANFYCI